MRVVAELGPAPDGSGGGGVSPLPSSQQLPPIRLITAEELAHELRFEGTTSSFRKFCKEAGIQPVPGRRDRFDPVAVRCRLNEIQGLGIGLQNDSEGALARSRARRNG